MSRPSPRVEVWATGPQVTFIAALAFLLGNVNALVDSVLHPEIPYFDSEHVIVGGVTALVSVALSVIVLLYVRRLGKALQAISQLEAMLPICASCKKIRRPGADTDAPDAWQPIESYITEKTNAMFSHGICPSCAATLYPEHCRKPGGERTASQRGTASESRGDRSGVPG